MEKTQIEDNLYHKSYILIFQYTKKNLTVSKENSFNEKK